MLFNVWEDPKEENDRALRPSNPGPVANYGGAYNEDYEHVSGPVRLDKCNGGQLDGKYGHRKINPPSSGLDAEFHQSPVFLTFFELVRDKGMKAALVERKRLFG